MCNAMIPKTQITLLFILAFSILHGQLKTKMMFSYSQEVCSNTYIFDSAGKFYIQGGCEGKGFISLGTYQLKSNKIILNFQKIDTTIPFLNIKENIASTDSTIKISFKDRFNVPFSDNYLKIDAIERSDIFFKPFKLNDKGQLIISTSKYKSLRIGAAYALYGKWLYIDLNTSDKEVVINFPKEFFFISNPKIDKSNNYILTLKKDGLYNSTGKEKIASRYK